MGVEEACQQYAFEVEPSSIVVEDLLIDDIAEFAMTPVVPHIRYSIAFVSLLSDGG